MFHALAPWRERVERANPLAFLRDEVDSVFDRFFGGWMAPAEFWKPTWGFAVEENEKEVVFRAEMPGFEAKELELNVTGEFLTIRAEHRVEPVAGAPAGKETIVPTERRRVERTISLPAGTDPEKLTATYRNGILEVHLPRVPEAQPRRIEVTT